MAITTFVRKEKKYLITEEQRQKLEKEIIKYMDLDIYCNNNGKSIVTNVYFDTDTYNVIRNSLLHPAYKEKIRIRTYSVEAKDEDDGFIEIKKKIAGVVNKRRIATKIKSLYDYLDNGIRPSNLLRSQEQVFNEIEYIRDNFKLAPAVYLSYVRTGYFAKDDRSVRLTIDEDIITRIDNMSLKAPRYGKRLLPEGYYLMEIKFKGSVPLWLANLLTKYKIFPTSFSKYGKFYENLIKEKIENV